MKAAKGFFSIGCKGLILLAAFFALRAEASTPDWRDSWRDSDNNITAVAVDPFHPGRVYAATWSSANRSKTFAGILNPDGTVTWHDPTNTTLSYKITGFAFQDTTPAETIYAATLGGGVQHATITSTGDVGEYGSYNPGLSGNALKVNVLVVDPNDPATLNIGTEGAGVYRKRGDAAWAPINGGQVTDTSYIRALAVEPFSSPRILYAGHYNMNGVHRGTVGGDPDQTVTWTPYSDGLPQYGGSTPQYKGVYTLAVDRPSPQSAATVFAGV